MKYLGIICLIILCACTDNQKVPRGIIEKERMQAVMWDMLQADRYVNDFLPKEKDSLYNKTEVFKVYQNVFNIHGITKDEFLKSYKFYLNNPDISKIIFDSIGTQTEKKRSEGYMPKARRDSLKRLGVDSLGKSPILDSVRKRLRKE